MEPGSGASPTRLAILAALVVLLKLKSANPALTGRLFPSYRVSVLEFPAALTERTMSFQIPMVLGASGSLELGHSARGAARSASTNAAKATYPQARLIKKSAIFFPDLSCATSQRGCLPRPDQVSLWFFGL